MAQRYQVQTHVHVSVFLWGFESGDFAAWSATVTNGGTLSVIPGAALHGTQGLQAQIVNNTGMYVRDDTPTAEARYRARFTFDPNSISIGYSGMHDIFVGRSGTIDVFRVQVTRLYGSYQLRTQARFDSATYTTTAWLPISDAAHLIEIDWQAATSSGANNGYLTLWIDGAPQSTLANLDNDTRRVDEARLGPSNSIDTYTRGTGYFDDFESRRSTYIGPAGSGSSITSTTKITYTYDLLYRLTDATYSNGQRLQYAYDAVGNRTTQIAMTKISPHWCNLVRSTRGSAKSLSADPALSKWAYPWRILPNGFAGHDTPYRPLLSRI